MGRKRINSSAVALSIFQMCLRHLSSNVHKQLGTLFWGVKEGSWEEAISVYKVFKEIRLDEITTRKSKAENQKNPRLITRIHQHWKLNSVQ